MEKFTTKHESMEIIHELSVGIIHGKFPTEHKSMQKITTKH